MSILDDFQDFGLQDSIDVGVSLPASSDFGRFDLAGPANDGLSNFAVSGAEGKGLFSVGRGTCERNVTRGRGQVLAVACAKDAVVIATSRNFVLRYNYSFDNLDNAGSFECEVELARPATDSRVQDIFLDPSSYHVLVNLQHPNGFDTHYIHSHWRASRPLVRMKGVSVCAVGWRPSAPPEREKGKDARDYRLVDDVQAEHTTREVLVGGAGGCLYTLLVETREKKEKFFKKVYEFDGEQICGLAQQMLRGGEKTFAMIITNVALYVLAGDDNLEQMFQAYNTPQAFLEPFCDLPIKESGSALLWNMGYDGWLHGFAWLVKSGVHHGFLALEQGTVEDDSSFINKLHLWQLERAEQAKGLGDPMGMAMTEFHFIILFDDSLLVVNRINGKVVQHLNFQSRSSRVTGKPLGLITDPITGFVYLYTTDTLVDVGSDSEDKDIWRVYMEMNDFKNALNVCQTNAQRDTVLMTQAEDALTQGNNVTAAQIYAKLHGTEMTFEDIALKFIQLEDSQALQEFLVAKLQSLGNEDRAQKTMVASWLTELHLDRINRALLEESGEEGTAYEACVSELRNFLSKHFSVLDVNTTVSLLASYGRMDDLMHYAECRHDHETLLECLMQRGDVRRALGVMRLPKVSRELVYKFAPDLMSLAPGLAVDFWLSQKNPPLDPRRLLAALVPFGDYSSNEDARKHALRFIEFSINALGCHDSAIHNLAIALYSLDDDELPLVKFIRQSAESALGSLCFDSKYALRLVRERNRPRACVEMLCVLGLYEDAVGLALNMDFGLAKSVARSKDLEDEGLKRKLWLAIAKHVIQNEGHGCDQEEHISKAVGLLDDADGLLKIEDILPFFPDFVTIDKFQGPIQHSLEEYNKQIERLKVQMDEATDIADALRKDIKILETRTAVVSCEQTCARCGAPMGEGPRTSGLPVGGCLQPFFVFPSGLVFHGVCLCKEVLDLVGERKKARILELMGQLAETPQGSTMISESDKGGPIPVERVQKQLELEVGAECPRNGEIVIRMIEKPFIDPLHDKEEMSGWRIKLRGIN
ncbi:hypothetical protein BSKO_10398 [Bryopsis sp. KO-2023]|nr:hypothetical protein BSKO_10398 [Bryopsis sp. KO-2023]